MSKVICDVCGTTYPETADQCPICGSARPEDPEIAEQESENTYTYVKGGRFSKGNVRKRNQERPAAPVVYNDDDDDDDDDYEDEFEDEEEEPARSNRGLAIVVIVLLLAIVAVVLYIYFTYLAPSAKPDSTQGTSASTAQTTEPTQDTQTTQDTQGAIDTTPTTTPSMEIPCTGINLTEPAITLSNLGDGYLMNITLEPADTTQTVTYGSSDPSVATVDEFGKITAMGPGSATITVFCGDVKVQCTVTCNIETEPTEPPTEPTEPPTEPVAELTLNRKDFTLFNPGETWTLYSGTVAKNLIVFSSDDETIATFVNGVVTYVGPGNVMVHAEYNGQKVSCLVHCRGEAPGDVGVDPKPDDTYTSNVLNDDGYLKVGESFVLRLFNSKGEAVKATWTVADSTILSVDGDTIKGLAKGTTTITATAGDQTYTCRITVR